MIIEVPDSEEALSSWSDMVVEIKPPAVPRRLYGVMVAPYTYVRTYSNGRPYKPLLVYFVIPGYEAVILPYEDYLREIENYQQIYSRG